VPIPFQRGRLPKVVVGERAKVVPSQRAKVVPSQRAKVVPSQRTKAISVRVVAARDGIGQNRHRREDFSPATPIAVHGLEPTIRPRRATVNDRARTESDHSRVNDRTRAGGGRDGATADARIGVDVGGTFTDVALVVDGELVTAKVPTTADQSEGALEGIEKACRRAGVEPVSIGEFTHAMTVSVNAILEGDGAETALVTTEGFRDVLEIGRQDRPALYDLDADKPEPLVPRRRRFEVSERTTVEGVEREIDDDAISEITATIRERDVESVAVAFLHAYAAPENERRLVDHLRSTLDVPVSASHEVLATFREYERTSTTVVDAYVRPAIDTYVKRLVECAADIDVPEPWIMQSNGGIADAATVRKRAVTTVLSGPAAGVVGAATTASPLATDEDLDGLVSFDMGGTSTDVSLVREGETARTTEAEIDGHPIGVPMVDVATVGSGGGSIARVDAGGALRVGPQSAGAVPGPACYGRGGTEPTVTDADLLLGYIGADTALGGEVSIDAEAAESALADLAAQAGLESATEAAAGVHRVANARMTRAIRSVTVERGRDPRNFGLVAFGGAGPVHAAGVADRLGIETVIVPLAGGVLSAYGLLAADERQDAARTHRQLLTDVDLETVAAICEELATTVRGQVREPGTASVEFAADLRYRGQSYELEVPLEQVEVPIDDGATEPGTDTDWFDPEAVADRFHDAHERAYGYRDAEPVELVTLRASATVERSVEHTAYAPGDESGRRSRDTWFDGEFRAASVLPRRGLAPGTSVDGPAVLEQRESTTVVPPGWNGRVEPDGTLLLQRGDDGD
jgi:N-methylhydantoinase A